MKRKAQPSGSGCNRPRRDRQCGPNRGRRRRCRPRIRTGLTVEEPSVELGPSALPCLAAVIPPVGLQQTNSGVTGAGTTTVEDPQSSERGCLAGGDPFGDHPVADLVGPGGMAKDDLQARTEYPLLQTSTATFDVSSMAPSVWQVTPTVRCGHRYIRLGQWPAIQLPKRRPVTGVWAPSTNWSAFLPTATCSSPR